jgi:hypothetical protein
MLRNLSTSYIKRQTEEFYEINIFPNSYFPFSVACVDVYCTCHNRLIIRYKSVHKFDKFNNGGLNRIGLTKDTS